MKYLIEMREIDEDNIRIQNFWSDIMLNQQLSQKFKLIKKKNLII